jgi:sulfatase maturation enzyme AslB (radical SAM superfamily)
VCGSKLLNTVDTGSTCLEMEPITIHNRILPNNEIGLKLWRKKKTIIQVSIDDPRELHQQYLE